MQEGKLISTKQLKLQKANKTILVLLSVCSFVFIFSLFASKTLLSEYSFQSKVMSAQQKTVNRLQTNKTAATQLINSYDTFENSGTNIIGGSSTGTSNQDGTNSKIILDALPDNYDFPALADSIENLLTIPGISIGGITGTDTSGSTATSTAVAPTEGTTAQSPNAAIPIPFTFTVTGPYASLNEVLDNLQSSIRPIQVLTINISGTDATATLNVTAQTYYLPSRGLSITKETVK